MSYELNEKRREIASALKGAARRWTRAIGLEIRPYTPLSSAALRRMRLLASTGVEVMLDIGANEGQYARELRRGGYRGALISFEPQSEAYEALRRRSDTDPRWAAYQLALGAASSTQSLNLSGLPQSSSFLPMQPRHVQIAPQSGYVGEEIVEVRTLDAFVEELGPLPSKLGLKIDVQGYEAQVLEGGPASLLKAVFVECEIQLEPLYEGQPSVLDLFSALYAAGLRLASTEPGWVDAATGTMGWMDAIFIRPSEGAI